MRIDSIPLREQWRRDIGTFANMNSEQRAEASGRVHGTLPALMQRMRHIDPNIKPDHLTPELRQHAVIYSQRLGPMGGGGVVGATKNTVAHIAPYPGQSTDLPDGCMEEDIRAWHLLHGTVVVVVQTMGGAVFSSVRDSFDDYWPPERDLPGLLEVWRDVLLRQFQSDDLRALHESEHGKSFGSEAQRWCKARRRYGLSGNALTRRIWLLGMDPEGRFRLMGEKIPEYLRQALIEADRRVGIHLGIIPLGKDLEYRDGV